MLITNGTIITWEFPNRILENQALRILDGKISEIGPQAELLFTYPDEERLDARGEYILPGNICAHTHFYGAFARGLAIPEPAPKEFGEILEKLWWPLDRALDEEAVLYSAQVCLIDAIKHGTTTLIDHHASPNAIPGSLDIIAEAVQKAGVRASLSYEVTDRNGNTEAQAGIQENVRFIERVKREKPADGRITASFGMHASLTLSDETLRACREALPDGFGFHLHAAEHEVDQYDCMAKSGTRVIDRLNKFGILGPRTIVAHAVHVDAREIELLAQTRTWVTHQPRSNMNNGVGIGEVESMLRAGVQVALGNDGFSNAMWEEWKTTYLVHKVWHRDPRRMNGLDVIQIAIYNNAALVSALFGELDKPVSHGVIKPGAVADMIFVKYHPFTEMTADNLPWHMLFGFHESMITTTIVDGKVLMRDRKLTTFDEDEIMDYALAVISPAVWSRYHSNE